MSKSPAATPLTLKGISAAPDRSPPAKVTVNETLSPSSAWWPVRSASRSVWPEASATDKVMASAASSVMVAVALSRPGTSPAEFAPSAGLRKVKISVSDASFSVSAAVTATTVSVPSAVKLRVPLRVAGEVRSAAPAVPVSAQSTVAGAPLSGASPRKVTVKVAVPPSARVAVSTATSNSRTMLRYGPMAAVALAVCSVMVPVDQASESSPPGVSGLVRVTVNSSRSSATESAAMGMFSGTLATPAGSRKMPAGNTPPAKSAAVAAGAPLPLTCQFTSSAPPRSPPLSSMGNTAAPPSGARRTPRMRSSTASLSLSVPSTVPGEVPLSAVGSSISTRTVNNSSGSFSISSLGETEKLCAAVLLAGKVMAPLTAVKSASEAGLSPRPTTVQVAVAALVKAISGVTW